jgi:hypothetical protein
MTNLTSFEQAVLDKLLSGQDPTLTALRRQCEQIQVSSRELTGVGFFTTFAVSPEAHREAGRPSFKFGDVNGTSDDVKHGFGFLVYVVDGVLHMLEGYTYDEPWPNEIRGLVLTYASPQGRKLDFVKGDRN